MDKISLFHLNIVFNLKFECFIKYQDENRDNANIINNLIFGKYWTGRDGRYVTSVAFNI